MPFGIKNVIHTSGEIPLSFCDVGEGHVSERGPGRKVGVGRPFDRTPDEYSTNLGTGVRV